jgi:hypothetical protein
MGGDRAANRDGRGMRLITRPMFRVRLAARSS